MTWNLDPDRIFDPGPSRRSAARELYDSVRDLSLVCPHWHAPPTLLADPDATLGTPAELSVIPDHYVFRMLYSRGVSMEDLGVPALRSRRITGASGSAFARTSTSSAVPPRGSGSRTSS